jgi:hypothetical protein
MVRKERLPDIERVLKLADAPFAAGQDRKDAQTLLIGDRLERAKDRGDNRFTNRAMHETKYMNGY